MRATVGTFPLRFAKSFLHAITLLFLHYCLNGIGRGGIFERRRRIRRRRRSRSRSRSRSRRRRRFRVLFTTGRRCHDNNNGGNVGQWGGGDHLRETLLLLHVTEVIYGSLTLGAVQYLAGDQTEDDRDDSNEDGYGSHGNRKGKRRRRQRWRRRKVYIIPPQYLIVPGSDGRVTSLSEAQFSEGRIGVPPHRAGHGIV